jgi:hypothetical protein
MKTRLEYKLPKVRHNRYALWWIQKKAMKMRMNFQRCPIEAGECHQKFYQHEVRFLRSRRFGDTSPMHRRQRKDIAERRHVKEGKWQEFP